MEQDASALKAQKCRNEITLISSRIDAILMDWAIVNTLNDYVTKAADPMESLADWVESPSRQVHSVAARVEANFVAEATGAYSIAAEDIFGSTDPDTQEAIDTIILPAAIGQSLEQHDIDISGLEKDICINHKRIKRLYELQTQGPAERPNQNLLSRVEAPSSPNIKAEFHMLRYSAQKDFGQTGITREQANMYLKFSGIPGITPNELRQYRNGHNAASQHDILTPDEFTHLAILHKYGLDPVAHPPDSFAITIETAELAEDLVNETTMSPEAWKEQGQSENMQHYTVAYLEDCLPSSTRERRKDCLETVSWMTNLFTQELDLHPHEAVHMARPLLERVIEKDPDLLKEDTLWYGKDDEGKVTIHPAIQQEVQMLMWETKKSLVHASTA